MISKNSSRFVFFFRQLYSTSVNVSCFILYTTCAFLVPILSHFALLRMTI